MTSALILHAAPAAGFDQPFEMLQACHERVERMLALLERLAAHLAVHLAAQGADAQAAQAAQDIVRYFDLAGPAHHEDEERHVFPVLAEQGDAAQRALVARLHQDHLAMAGAWPAVRADLLQMTGFDPAAAVRWAAYAALYRGHIEAEEALAYPAAQRLLDAAAQAAMGREMARRRGAI